MGLRWNLKSLFCASSLLLCSQLVGCDGSDASSGSEKEVVNPPPSSQPKKPSDVLALTFSGEEENDIRARFEETVSPTYNPVFDGTLTGDQITLVQKDLSEIASLKFEAEKLGRFAGVFGDPNAGGTFDYLKARMKIFVGQDAQGFRGKPNSETTFLESNSLLREDNKKAFMTAQNFGTLLWYNKLIFQEPVFVKGQKANYEVKSMRDGVVMLLEGYLTTVKDTKGVRQRISSPSTLIHEARHSDCSVALSQDQIKSLRNSEDLLKGDLRCGHLHVACPKGHILEGLNACDQDYWGAYSVSGFYSQMVETACTNCTEDEREQARMARIDSLSRVLPAVKNPDALWPDADMQHVETAL